MGNAKSSGSSVASLDRKRTVNKRAGGKTKTDESQSSWQPPAGLRSYTCVDTELPGAGDRGNGGEDYEREGDSSACVFILVESERREM